jgi:hypothetical protein
MAMAMAMAMTMMMTIACFASHLGQAQPHLLDPSLPLLTTHHTRWLQGQGVAGK